MTFIIVTILSLECSFFILFSEEPIYLYWLLTFSFFLLFLLQFLSCCCMCYLVFQCFQFKIYITILRFLFISQLNKISFSSQFFCIFHFFFDFQWFFKQFFNGCFQNFENRLYLAFNLFLFQNIFYVFFPRLFAGFPPQFSVSCSIFLYFFVSTVSFSISSIKTNNILSFSCC